GTAQAGRVIPGPPTVSVRDGFGNRAAASSAPITVAIGTNPAGGTLAGTTTKNAAAGIAAFDDLTISQAGSGYTLRATAPALTTATTSPFTIAAPTGTIEGRVTRNSDDAPLTGAVVSALQAGAVKGSVTTNADGGYSLAGLAVGSYDVRVSATGY